MTKKALAAAGFTSVLTILAGCLTVQPPPGKIVLKSRRHELRIDGVVRSPDAKRGWFIYFLDPGSHLVEETQEIGSGVKAILADTYENLYPTSASTCKYYDLCGVRVVDFIDSFHVFKVPMGSMFAGNHSMGCRLRIKTRTGYTYEIFKGGSDPTEKIELNSVPQKVEILGRTVLGRNGAPANRHPLRSTPAAERLIGTVGVRTGRGISSTVYYRAFSSAVLVKESREGEETFTRKCKIVSTTKERCSGRYEAPFCIEDDMKGVVMKRQETGYGFEVNMSAGEKERRYCEWQEAIPFEQCVRNKMGQHQKNSANAPQRE